MSLHGDVVELLEKRADGGITYVKSKHVAREVGRESSSIGYVLSDLSKSDDLDFEMEVWGSEKTTNGHTWKIDAREGK